MIAKDLDPVGRAVRSTVESGNMRWSSVQSLEYDGLGRVTRATDNNDWATDLDDSTVTRAYDSLGRVVEEVQNGSRVAWSYTGVGVAHEVTYPSLRREAMEWSLDCIEYAEASVGAPERFLLRYQEIHAARVRLDAERLRVLHRLHVLREWRDARPAPLPPGVVARLGPCLRILEQASRRLEPPPLDPTRLPPCIKTWTRMLQEGAHLNHAQRFSWAAFHVRLGASAESLVAAFRFQGNYDERRTRVQLESIRKGEGGRGYRPFSCARLRAMDLCPDPSCGAASMLQEYRRRCRQ